MTVSPEMVDDVVVVPARPCEDELVLEWRTDRCIRMGFGDDEAAALAVDLSIDLHLLERLLKAGCPRELARRIV